MLVFALRSPDLAHFGRVSFGARSHVFHSQPCRRALAPSSASFASCHASNTNNQHRELTLIHFNDVYNIESRKIEPIGGAARFAHLVNTFRNNNNNDPKHGEPLILFSGDCLNPSLLSAFTKGEHMVPILNSIGVNCAAVGNHDFDFGVDVLRSHLWRFRFPWLLSNVLDARTGQPLGGAQRSTMITWNGINVGLMGLVEREWLLTIPSIEADRDIHFLDFIEEGRRLAASLKASGADVIIALTHMRSPNDRLLAAALPEIQLVLGGHDHDYEIIESEPHGTLIVKSGTDFRELSHITLQLPDEGARSRPIVKVTRMEVTSDVPEDSAVAATVSHYQGLMGAKMDEPLGRSFVDLDATFDCVRTRESNVGNLLGDIMRLGLGADVAFFNGGTIRSDQIHHSGTLTLRDFVTMLPFTDELVVLSLSGADIIRALETGVASWPKKEGRFLQMSNISFAFDPSNEPQSRVVPGSVYVAGAPIDLDRKYKVATKFYLRSGKDGFDSLKGAEVVVDGETAPRLATLVHYLLTRIEELNEQRQAPACEINGPRPNSDEGPSSSLVAVCDAPHMAAPCAHGLDALYYYDTATCTFGIAPRVEGRIVRVGLEANSTSSNTSSSSSGSESDGSNQTS